MLRQMLACCAIFWHNFQSLGLDVAYNKSCVQCDILFSYCHRVFNGSCQQPRQINKTITTLSLTQHTKHANKTPCTRVLCNTDVALYRLLQLTGNSQED